MNVTEFRPCTCSLYAEPHHHVNAVDIILWPAFIEGMRALLAQGKTTGEIGVDHNNTPVVRIMMRSP